MEELKEIKATAKPTDTLLVVDAMTGQEAAQLTKSFNDAVDISGAILTKLDGDSRGGAALSVKAVSGKPIKFVGTGESMDELEPFYPDRLAGRVLGMGDVLTLVRPPSSSLHSCHRSAQFAHPVIFHTVPQDTVTSICQVSNSPQTCYCPGGDDVLCVKYEVNRLCPDAVAGHIL